ncbi:MAG TPA: hypothetical protein VNO24_06685, partial [Blastocatellia bacterium]|nr:hypothetical protein [Blastocatellia bacterium]
YSRRQTEPGNDGAERVKKALARQVWQDYDVEDDSHEEDLLADEDGHVRFDERSIRTSPRA